MKSKAQHHNMEKANILLACGAIAGPIYLLVGFTQAFTRTGFDMTRHPLSLLSNGELGWIQIMNFVVSGLLVIAGALGMRRVLSGVAALWGPLLISIYGISLIAAGIFVPDPVFGFQPGAPMSMNTMSSSGLLHFMSGGIGFFALIAACFLFARRFMVHKELGWAWYSMATGIIFFAAFFGIASGSRESWINIAFTVAVILAWAWITAVSFRLRK